MNRRGGTLLLLLWLTGCELTRLDLGMQRGGDGGGVGGGRDAGGGPPIDAAATAGRSDGGNSTGISGGDGANAGADSALLPAGDGAVGPMDGGSDAGGMVTSPATIVDVALGGRFSCVQRADGTAKCFGSNGFGELGVAPATSIASCDGIPCDAVPHGSAELTRVRALALGETHGCLRDDTDAAFCWGGNRLGELGRGTFDPDPHAKKLAVDGLSTSVTDMASGDHHTCVVQLGKVLCWGLNHRGQLGVPPGDVSSCTVSDAALLQELGLPGPDVPCARTPVQVAAIADAVVVFARRHQTCVRRASGTLSCWGQNTEAQLAQPSAVTLPPTEFASTEVEAFALGARHGCATFGASRRLRCWGANDVGALGVGSVGLADCGGTPCTDTPAALSDLLTADALVAGDGFTCALVAGGVSCWGSDARGTLGDSAGAPGSCGATPCATTPVSAYGLASVVLLRAGTRHVCALLASGELRCWGENDRSQCGDFNNIDFDFPRTVYGLDR